MKFIVISSERRDGTRKRALDEGRSTTRCLAVLGGGVGGRAGIAQAVSGSEEPVTGPDAEKAAAPR